MTTSELVKQIKASLPVETIIVGRFTITLRLEPDFWIGGWAWVVTTPSNWHGTPEEARYDDVMGHMNADGDCDDFVRELKEKLA